MSLTAAQKTAGRAFREAQLARLAALPAAARCSGFIREYRHSCIRASGVSVAIRMREHSEPSPAYGITAGGEAVVIPDEIAGHFAVAPGVLGESVPAALFAFTWLDGKCTCGLTVRSAGRVVLAAQPREA